jgi:hypothetical protein
MWLGVSSDALLELEPEPRMPPWELLLAPRGMLKASPLVEEDSWLVL